MSKDFSEEMKKAEFAFEGPHLVSASAGTGKTYSIQNVCARLVAERGLGVSQILVVTFTEAATSELRDRIRSILKQYRDYLNGWIPSDPKVRERLEELKRCLVDGGIDEDLARIRLTQAISTFDSASISTIHGFCRKVLSRHAFETSAPFDAELTDEDGGVVDRLVRDWWRKTPADERDDYDIGTLMSYARQFVKKPEAEIAATEGTPEALMMCVAKDIAVRYHELRGERATRTFDELLLSVRDALRGSQGVALAAELRAEFKAVVVDEFQDTDPVQYEIFRRAFMDVPDGVDKPILFFVGDPKQAIYSFRGGDIYMYRAATQRADLTASTFRLQKNYRSNQRLVDAVNLLFRDTMGKRGKISYTFGDESIDYPDDLCADESKRGLQIAGQDDPTPFRVVDTDSAETMIDSVVDSVLDLLENQQNEIYPRDVAVLVATGTTGKKIKRALNIHKIPAVFQGSGNVFGQLVAKEFYAVLSAMANGDEGSVRNALRTKFFDSQRTVTGEDFDQDVLADVILEMRRIGSIWRKSGFEKAVAEFENYKYCRFRERFANENAGERLLADFMQIVDLCVRIVRRQGPTPEVLLEWLGHRISLGWESEDGKCGAEAKSDAYARELESERNAVRIITMHKSKGLEFPFVIVPLPGKNPPSGDVHEFHRIDSPDNNLAMTDEQCEQWKQEQRDEKTRLLYVAFTRATKRTIVVKGRSVASFYRFRNLLANAKANWPRFQQEHPGVEFPILETTWTVPEGGVGKYNPKVSEIKTQRPVPEFPDIDMSPAKGSYSSLAPGKAGKGVRDDDGEDAGGADGGKESPVLALPAGAKVGTCWHEILERIDFKADAAIDEVVENALTVHGLMKGDPEVAAANAQTVAAMIRANLDYVLTAPDGEKFTLRDIEKKDRISEWEFDFSAADTADRTPVLARLIGRHWHIDPGKEIFLEAIRNWDRFIPKGSFVGFLDLVFRHNGYYYIVDWKSNAINRRSSDFSATGVAREMAAHGYFFQYLLYSVVLHRFLKETLGKNYSWERHFGGIRYYFLRGVAIGSKDAVFVDRPSERMLNELGEALGL